ncbi:heat shock protein Hsp20 [Cognatiyoonia koreensis]|uniref:Heat shock protein Hsp20 n=1 Tax=Cognatiyoonia koreensis TaxID=364200 RepID=A0A1I0QHV2_9RHOB|nr:Hsp20/alpha crystallin family protein [Cognatiyoonia koreensis]SEW26665.1 heat shock protein Hsp20 [Cognatiyoonia koreensis]
MQSQSLPDTQADNSGTAFFPSFQREMNRLIDQFRNGFPIAEALAPPFYGSAVFPSIDVVETEDALEISAEVPGVSEKDIDVTITGDRLTIKGEKTSEHEDKKEGLHRIERHYGSFHRLVPLGFAPADDAVDAKFADGVLKLRIAKPAEAKAKVHKVNINES